MCREDISLNRLLKIFLLMNVELICLSISGIHMISRLFLGILISEMSASLAVSKSSNLLAKMIYKACSLMTSLWDS